MDLKRNYKTGNNLQLMYRDFIRGSIVNKKTVSNQTLYTQILYKLFRRIMHYMMFNSYVYVMKGLGRFNIIKYLPEMKETEEGYIITNRALDMVATRKAIIATGNSKLRVYYDNEATGGYIYRAIWDTGHAHFVNKNFYMFKLSRPLRAIMKREILNNKVIAKIVDFKL